MPYARARADQAGAHSQSFTPGVILSFRHTTMIDIISALPRIRLAHSATMMIDLLLAQASRNFHAGREYVY